MNCNWYVIRTHTAREAAVSEAVGALDIQTDIPLIARDKRSHKRNASTHVPLLKGYVFANFDPSTENWKKIRRTPYVVDILGSRTIDHDGDIHFSPQPIRDGSLQRLKAFVAACEAEIEAKATRLKHIAPGTLMAIMAGPFQGRTGTLDIDEGNRIKLLLHEAGVTRTVSVLKDIAVVVDQRAA